MDIMTAINYDVILCKVDFFNTDLLPPASWVKNSVAIFGQSCNWGSRKFSVLKISISFHPLNFPKVRIYSPKFPIFGWKFSKSINFLQPKILAGGSSRQLVFSMAQQHNIVTAQLPPCHDAVVIQLYVLSTVHCTQQIKIYRPSSD